MGIARPERQRGKSAQRRDMAAITFQDVAEYVLGRLTVACDERGSCLLDARAVRIQKARLLERELRVYVLFKINQHIAVGEPGALERRRLLQDALQLSACILRAPDFTIGARKVDARMRKIRGCGNGSFERLDGGRKLALREQRNPQQAQTVDLAGRGRLDRTQLPLGAVSSSHAQCRQSLAVGGAPLRL